MVHLYSTSPVWSIGKSTGSLGMQASLHGKPARMALAHRLIEGPLTITSRWELIGSPVDVLAIVNSCLETVETNAQAQLPAFLNQC
jgi:hypothetical protein